LIRRVSINRLQWEIDCDNQTHRPCLPEGTTRTMKFIPVEVKFSDHFEELVEKIEEGGILFTDILNDYRGSETKISRLKEIEREADVIAYGIYQKLHKTFITPMDREDIYALANKLDTILDLIESSATRMSLFKMKGPNPDIKDLALILNKSIGLVKKVIYAMRQRKKNVRMIQDTCIEINTLENEGDYVLRQATAHLFEREDDAIELVKWKEILERIEEATDMCEDVSNIIEGMILKYG
jgi:predicted phosphate transport protein (TIGR00153 family)